MAEVVVDDLCLHRLWSLWERRPQGRFSFVVSSFAKIGERVKFQGIFAMLLLLCFANFLMAYKVPVSVSSMGKFFDKSLATRMKKHHAPGVVVAVLKDGKLFFAKGYGYSHIAQKVLMDPHKTVIRLGSISKLLTATTLMTFCDEGKFRTEDPVKRYLPQLKIRNSFAKPLCVRHLLTHTAGFDARYMNVLGRTSAPFIPLRKYLETYLPPLVRQPGEVVQYCNFGASLAGLLVEELAETTLAQAAQKRIFTTLEMKNTQFFSNKELEKGIARGYGLSRGKLHELSYDFVPITPAGGASSTAIDMAHLAEMFLAKGKYKGRQVLQPATVEQMQKRQFTNHQSFAGMGFGFFQYDKNGLRLVGHGGGVLGFASIFYLVPKHRFAYFVATNLSNGFAFLDDVERDILNEYFPLKKKSTAAPAAKAKVTVDQNELSQFCGRYRGNRFPRSTCDRMLAIVLPFISEKRIALDGDGDLVMDSVKFYFFSRYATKLIPISKNLFRRADGRGNVAFIKDNENRVKYMAFSSSPVSVFDAVAWYDTQLVHAFLLSLFAIIYILGFLVVFLPWWKKVDESPVPSLGRGMQFAQCFFNLFIPLLPIIAVFPMEWECPNLVYGWPSYLRPFLYLPHLSCLFTISSLLFMPKALKKCRGQSKEGKIYIAVLIASLLYLPYLAYWNFLP